MHSHGSIREALTLAASQTDLAAAGKESALLHLVSAGENLRAALRAELARVGLTVEGFQTLAALSALDPAPACPTTLAEQTATTKALLSHTLTRLELSHLVTRDRDANDRRVIWVRLTPDGRELAQRALLACRQCVGELTEGFSPAELRTLCGLCEKLDISALRISHP